MYNNIIEDCTSALSIEQNYEKALTRRAKAYENVGKLQEAFEDLTSLCILQKFSTSSMAIADRMVKKIGEKMCEEIFSVQMLIKLNPRI
jgi:import receptor subunit TOM70